MAAPGHQAYTNSASFRGNFDRDLYCDSIIANRGIIQSLSVTSLTISGVTCFADGSAAAPSIAFCSDLDTGIYRVANGALGISDEGQLVTEFFTNGAAAEVTIGNAPTVTDIDLTLGSGALSNDINFKMVSTNGSVHINAHQTVPPVLTVDQMTWVVALTAESTDTAGSFVVTDDGSAMVPTLGVVTLTFNNAFLNAPTVILSPMPNIAGPDSVAQQQVAGFITTVSNTAFTMSYLAPGPADLAGTWSYHVIGNDI